MTSFHQSSPPYPPDRLVLSFEILEPSLDKIYHLPMDLLDLGRFLLRISQSVLIPVMHTIYRELLKFPSRRSDNARVRCAKDRTQALNKQESSFSRGCNFVYKKDALGMILNGSETVSGLSCA